MKQIQTRTKQVIWRLVKGIRSRFRGWLGLPLRVEITDLPSTGTLKFNTYSGVEYTRTKHYGLERDELLYFLSMLQPDDVVFDIGASVGLWTVAAARIVGQGKIYAFEPDPSTFARLQENIQLNKLSNATPLAWALSDQEGTTTLFSDGVEGYAPSMVRQTRERAPSQSLSVSMRSLDAALSDQTVPLPTVLKIDIEGAEGLCLAGARGLLESTFGLSPRFIMMEVHPAMIEAIGGTAAEVEEQLAAAGYRSVWHVHHENRDHIGYLHTRVTA